jgi:hypothetical protein
MVGEVFYKKCLSAINAIKSVFLHVLNEVKIRALVVGYVEVCFLLLIKKRYHAFQ